MAGKNLADVRNISGVVLECKIDATRVAARFLEDDLVECKTPPHREGWVHVEFTLNGETSSCPSNSISGAGFQYASPGSVKSVFSHYGEAGSVLDVWGDELKPSSLCRLGDTPVQAHFISSMLTRCEVPWHRGEESVVVDVSDAVGTFGRVYSDVEFQYTPRAVLGSVSPRLGNSAGGTTIAITGRNFANTNTLRCKIGTIETAGVWKSATRVECISPAAQPPPANSRRGHPVRLSTNQKDFTSGELGFVYVELSGVDAAFPTQLPDTGGTRVMVHLPVVRPSESPKCRFGTHVSPGVLEASTGYLSCVSPAAAAGFVAVDAARNGEDFEHHPPGRVSANAIIVEMKTPMEIALVYPDVGFRGGGSVVRVTGDHILFDDTRCKFGFATGPAHAVSSALLLCEVPEHESINVAVELVTAASTALEPLVRPNFIFDELPVVTAVNPSGGSVDGGNVVTAGGHFFSELHDMACRFGAITPVAGEWIAADEFRCVAPAAFGNASGFVEFNVGIKDEYVVPALHNRPLLYEYVVTPTMTTVMDNDDGTVTVIGTGFSPGEKVFCNLGSELGFVPGTVQDSNTIICSLPEGLSSDIDPGSTVILDENGNNILSPTRDDGDGLYGYEGAMAEDSITAVAMAIDTVGPNSGPTSGGTLVVIHGDHFTPSLMCRFGQKAPVAAIFVSSNQIACEAPAQPHEGAVPVELSNDGFTWTSAGYVFAYGDVATLEYIAPRQGSVDGGSVLRLTGQEMPNTEVLSCRVGTISHIASRWLSSTTSACHVPAHAEDVVPMGLQSHAADWDMYDVKFAYMPPPNVTSVYPVRGSVTGGTRVTVEGVNFPSTGRAVCRFGATPVAALTRTATQIVCASPSLKAGITTVEVSVNRHDFTLAGLQFQYVAMPNIFTIAPKAGPTHGGTVITVQGEHFNADLSQDVGTNCKFTNYTSGEDVSNVVSSRLMLCEVPANDVGNAQVELSINSLETTSDLQTFRFLPPPEVEGVYPVSGSEAGGDMAVVYGSFQFDSDDVSCRVGTISGVQASLVSAEEITCLMPGHAPGAVPLDVTLNRWDHTQEDMVFNFQRFIEVQGPYPTRVFSEGGGEIAFWETMTNLGSQFSSEFWENHTDASHNCVVDAHPVPASRLPGSIDMFVCMTPSHAPGFAALDVQMQDSQVISVHPLVLEYVVTPSVTDLMPSSTVDAGVSVIKVSGRHMVGQEVYCRMGFDGLVTAGRVSSALVKCEAPAHSPGTVVVELSMNDDGQQLSHSDVRFEYTDEISVVGVEPRDGPQSGGTVVRLSLSAPDAPVNVACRFGTVGPLASRLGGGGAECATPAHDGGAVSVSISSNEEVWDTSEVIFGYSTSAEVFAIKPTSTSVSGGAIVLVMGSGLHGDSVQCRFGLEMVPGEYVGGDELCVGEARGTVAVDGGDDMTLVRAARCMGWVEVMCIAPPHAPGVVTLEVSAAQGGFSTSKIEFTYQSEAVVLSVQPASGPTAGVGVVKVAGTHLIGDGALCGFGSSDPVDAEVVSSALVKCEAPSHAPGLVSLELSTAGEGQTFSQSGMVYEYVDEAMIVGITPDEGPTEGGTVVTLLHESGPSTLLACSFGSVFPVVARVEAFSIACASPAMTRHAAVTPVGTRHVSLVASSVEALFSYVPTPVAAEAIPGVAPGSGGVVVAVVVLRLAAGATASCRFGDRIVHATRAEADHLGLDATFTAYDTFTLPIPGGMSSSDVEEGMRSRPVAPTIVLCEAPASHGGGFTTVSVGVDGSDGAVFGLATRGAVEFEYETPARVASVMPTVGMTEGGTVVRVSGAHFSLTNRPCGFGGASPFDAEVISSAMVVCESPARVEGAVSLEIGLDDSGNAWTRDAIVFEFVDRAMMTAANPARALESGGVLMALRGARFRAEAFDACAFGAVGPLSGRLHGQESVECVTPAAVPGWSAVAGASVGGAQDRTDASVAITVFADPEVDYAFPTRGVLAGGSRVNVVGRGLAALTRHGVDDAGVRCVFGESTSLIAWAGLDESGSLEDFASVVAHASPKAPDGSEGAQAHVSLGSTIGWSVVACDVPAQPPGAVSVGISMDLGSFISLGAAQFIFAPRARIFRVDPGIITDDLGAVVRAVGVDFHEDLGPAETGAMLCAFGSAESASHAHFVSSAMIACETPALPPAGLAQLHLITEHGELWTEESAAIVEVVPSIRASAVEPSSGWEEGGGAVEVHVGTLLFSVADNSLFPPFACQFGTVAPVASRAGSASMTCITPAEAPGLRPVGVSPGLNLGAAPAFRHLARPEIVGAYPLWTLSEGGMELSFFGSETISQGGLACHVDGVVREARAVSATEIRCEMPARAPGIATVSIVPAHFAEGIGPRGLALSVGSNPGERSDGAVEIEFFAPFALAYHFPRKSPTIGGTVLSLYGDGFAPGRHLAHFGSVTEPVDVVSSVVARCIAPPRRYAGDVIAQMSAGIGEEQVMSLSGLATGLHTYYLQPVIGSFDPEKAKSNGGQVIVIAGEHFKDSEALACKFGTVGPVLATYESEFQISCKAPARIPNFYNAPTQGFQTLEVSVNAYDYTEFGRTIEYEPGGEDAEGDGSGPWGALGFIDGYTIVFDVLDVQGPVTGGTASVLDGANFDPQETSCKFQMTQTAGVYVSRFRFICVTPPMPAGFVAYELIAGTEVTTYGFQFHFHARVTVTLLEPPVASPRGGEVVFVNGENFMRPAELGQMADRVSTFCAMGTTTMEEGAFMSSALVACELLPFPEEADLAMEVSLNRVDKSSSKVTLRLRDTPELAGVYPWGAPAEGGGTITVMGTPFAEDTHLGCKLGTLGPVAAMILSPEEALCVLPSHTPDVVPLTMTNNFHDVATHALEFHYRYPAVVEAVFPERGLAGGGTSIVVTGAYFDQGEQPYCRMGAQLVATDTVQTSFILCLTPPSPPGFVRVGVADGAADGIVDGAEDQGAWFHYQAPAVTTASHPPGGGVGGGTLVRVIGHDMISFEPDDILCHFGGDEPQTARSLSSVLAVCESTAHGEGVVALEMGVAAEGPVAGFHAATFEYAPEPFLAALEPTTGPTEGGTVVFLSMAGAEPWSAGSNVGGLAAQFGAVWPLALRPRAEGGGETVVPARAPGSVATAVASDASSALPSAVALRFEVRAPVPEVIAAYPDATFSGGGASVEVTVAKGRGFEDEDIPTVCRFGIEATPATFVSAWEACASGARATRPPVDAEAYLAQRRRLGECVGYATVRCVAPPHAAGWTRVSVDTEGSPSSAVNGRAFEFRIRPQLFGANPSSGPSAGGTIARLSGAHLHHADACWVGASPATEARVVSSAVASCEIPALIPGTAGLAIGSTRDAPAVDDSFLHFDVLDDARVLSMTPRGGSSSGGVAVTIIADPAAEASAAASPACDFGSTRVAARRNAAATGFECVTPAIDPVRATSVVVRVSLNGEDTVPSLVGSEPLAFAYRPDPALAAVVADGGGATAFLDATDGLDALATDLPGLSCVFGDVISSARTLGAVAGGGVSISCVAPPEAAGRVGFVAFAVISAENADPTSRGIVLDFAFDARVEVMLAVPSSGSHAGGTLVHLLGVHVPRGAGEGPSPTCRFGGGGPSALRVVSSAMATCEAPASSGEGSTTVGVAAHSGVLLAESETLPVFEFLTDAFVSGVFPQTGSEFGGSSLVISGADFAPSSAARFGTLAPVAARWISNERIETFAPAHDTATGGGVVPVEVSANNGGSNTWSQSGVVFAYVAPIDLEGTSFYASPAVGGGEVTVIGSGLHRSGDAPWSCRFGDAHVDAREVRHALPAESCGSGACVGWSAIVCAVPPSPAGFTVLAVAVGGEHPGRAQLEFSFDAPAGVVSGFPGESPSDGGGLVFVMGANLRPGDGHVAPLCRFGDGPLEGAPGVVVSSALMLCEAPERDVGIASLAASVSDGGVTYSYLAQGAGGASGVTHHFAPTARVTGSNPLAGPESGGTVIGVSGVDFQDGPMLACRFGSTFPVAAAFIGSDLVECVSPSMFRPAGASPGYYPLQLTIPLGVTGNGRDYTPGGGLFGSRAAFEYQAILRVTGVTPRSGVTGGRTPVFVTGVGFVNTTLLSCRLGREVVPATYLTPFSILCIAPEQPTGAGTVFIEVSNNAEDWTSERTLFHFAPCPAGYYCPEGEPLPCPRGAFCSGGSGGAANFTLCPVGTFQPRTTQSSCLPTPVGFISPDVGTSMPSVCPRGAVCDVTGLSGPSKSCPPGHYCLEGTRTSNFTDFGTPERPLPCPFGTYCGPGVTTNRTIANNFTTPQTCFAGFMCEPGSATPQGSGPCPSGHYCPPGQLIPCPSRTYCPGVANTEPKPCVPGLFQQEYGQSECKKCPLGTICPGFARQLPEACPPGFVCDEVGLPIPAKRCPAGHYCLSNTLTPDPLSALDENALLRSSPIQMEVGQFRPLPCLPATYCMEGVMTNITNEGVFTQPQPCKEGSYCEWATSDKTFAVEGDVSSPMYPCPPGNYCPKGTYIPIPAPRGFFARNEGNSDPAMCLPGSYTHYEGFQECLACPAGYECTQDGTYKPTICPSGTVRSLRDSVTCKSCPMGTWNPFRGVTDESLCIPCNPGLVCSAEGTENNKPFGDNVEQVVNEFILDCENELETCKTVELQPLGRATLCPEGYVCDARTSVAAVKCPDGYFCGYGTSPETQFVNKCPAGYFCPEGTAASGRFQFPCSACHYCPEGTGVILPRCPEGTESDPNAENIDQCFADRITFWRIQPLKRVLIDEAYAMLLLAYNESTSDRRRSLLELGEAEEDLRIGGEYASKPRKYAQGISRSAVDKLGEYVSALPRMETYGDEMRRRRRLLQDPAADPADPEAGAGAEADPNAAVDADYASDYADGDANDNVTVVEAFDTNYFGECKGTNFDLLKPEFIMDEDGEPALDIENTPMVKFTLPRGYMAKVKLDFRFIDDFIRHGQQYEVAVFVDDRVNDMKCKEEDFARVPCPPWDIGDGVNRKTMGIKQDQLFEEKCPKSTEALELPYWFQGNGVPGATDYNVQNPAMGTYVWKRGLHELNIGGLDDITFRFEIRMLHGLYQNATRRGFLDTMCIDTIYPERGGKGDKNSFHVILENNDLQIPLNVPYREPYQRSIEEDYLMCSETSAYPSCRYVYPKITMDYNSTFASEWKQYVKQEELEALAGLQILEEDDENAEMTDDVIIEENGEMHVPDVVEKEEFIFTEDYWTQGRPLLAVDYLPFFSGCRGFDSHIYFYYLTEVAWTEIEEFVNYGFCNLVPVNETIFIDQWAPQVFTPVADECEVEIKCFYEERFKEAAASTRWFEVEGDTLFHITQEAEPQSSLFEASVLANDQTEPEVNTGTYEAAVAAQESIPVMFNPAEGVEVVRGIIPTEISIDISYFQFSPLDKRMISAEGEFDGYVNAKKHDGSYLLTVTTAPLNFFNLLNFFAFEEIFYIALFHALGLVSVMIVVGLWAMARIFTTLKDPPRFRFSQYLGIVSAAPIKGIFLAMTTFMIAQFAIVWLLENFTFFTQFPISIDDLGREIDNDVVAKATAGRMSLSFLTVSCYYISCAAEILVPAIPEMEKLRESEEESVMQPESWKRSHYILANILINITNIALMEFSFTDTYGMYFFIVFLLMKVFHILLEMQTEAFLGEVMLLTPISVGLQLTAGLVTIAADDFTDFTMGYYLELIIGLIEFIYLDAFIAYMAKLVPSIRRKISLRLRLRRQRNLKQQLVGDKIIEEDSIVEDLMGFLTAYGTATASLYMTPFMIYFYWAFNDQLQLSFLFGFRKKDLIIYLLFAIVIVPFQIVIDIFIFNTQELFHGWKVYEYMKYARYRFNNRTARWKGLEKSYDESIDYSLRTVDQMCFSSQFYFVLGIGGTGSFLFVLSLSMMLRAQYNMFEDILFGLVVAVTLGLCVIARKVFLTLADIVGLWKISQAQMDDGMINEDDLPTDFQSFDRAKDTDRDTEGTGRGEFTMADLTTDTFRRKFLEHNRMWLIDQLAELLTPRTAKKFRKAGGMMKIRGAGSLSDSDSDEGDRDRFEDDVELSTSSERIMQMWRHEASKRTRGGRFARAAGGLSETSDSDADRGPKFPPVTLSAEASALIMGWLAATRAVREARGDRAPGELSSSDTDGEGAKWGTPVLHPASKRLLADWLERARARNPNKGASRSGIYSESEGSSDDGFGMAVALRPASSRLMLNWLGHVRARRGGQRRDADDPDLLMLQRHMRDIGSSSDEDDLGGRRFDEPATVSVNAQRLVKWWLQNLRRQMEEETAAGDGDAPLDVDDSDDEDSFEDSSDDSFPTSPAGGGGGGPMVTSSDQFRTSGTDGLDEIGSPPESGSSGDSALDSSD